jgi:hypothetical protein
MARPRIKNGAIAGFALVIQEPGVYWFKGMKIVCRVSLPGEAQQEKVFFSAYLPLVFRESVQYDYNSTGLDRVRCSGYGSKYTDRSRSSGIIVEDAKGLCGFIAADIRELTIEVYRPE